MAGRIPQDFIDDLMSRTDIVEVIDERVPLKKKGKDFMACCPFHAEKTPSFSVSQEKQFYYCFGCGAHGTSLGFLMDFGQLDFLEAVEDLARRAGVQVPRQSDDGGELEQRRVLFEVLEKAGEYFRRQLAEHPDRERAVQYLRSRDLSPAVSREFELGFAPPGWDNVCSALGTTASAREALNKAGLSIVKSGGRPYDRFRDRVVFPIHDRRGRILGFGGRVLDDEDEPKYLNSPETPVFHKGRGLYGLRQAQEACRKTNRILVVEGYMDVLALNQHGVAYAVATLGTAATREHMEQLFRAAYQVIFCFDGDTAGRRAAWRALETALPLMTDGRQANFLFLPDGEDPDSFIRTHGGELFEERVAQAPNLSRFFYDHLSAEVDTTTPEGQARLVETARPLLAKLPDGVFRKKMLSRLGEITELDPADFPRDLTRLNKKPGQAGGGQAKANPTARSTTPLVRTAVTLLLQHPRLAALAPAPDGLGQLKLPGTVLLMEMLDFLRTRPHLNTGGVLEHFRSHESFPHLQRLAAHPPLVVGEGIEDEWCGALNQLEKQLEKQFADQLVDQRLKEFGDKKHPADPSKSKIQQLKVMTRRNKDASDSEK